MTRYVAITPARDEEAFLPGLIHAMASQEVAPLRWIIIDDGSADRTGAIIDEAAHRYPYIEPHHRPRLCAREPGGESIIMQFLPPQVWRDADFIVRFDADLLFGPGYLHGLFEQFALEPRLGIASGTLYENCGGRWTEDVVPEFHTRGASKVYSRLCFEAIGGLESGLGWDTIDEVRAMMAGFITRRFRHLHAYHRRNLGTARGLWRGRMGSGVAAYKAGYSPAFMIARAARNLLSPPLLAGGLLLIAGYLRAVFSRTPVLANETEIRFVRAQQWRRLTLRDTVWR